ncbi:hypothetical protein OEG86_20245 [Hoeflea alexandrii]|uniref:hypothetical protein n=1 Tax=Hoeflea alexandrii TaxID=288436 RepID=UPI00226D67E2|nr:hypothetical protein [Hoeflea alexandrii]MCY0154170.1 hypothetical protein [Hoeflea alexandrii]
MRFDQISGLSKEKAGRVPPGPDLFQSLQRGVRAVRSACREGADEIPQTAEAGFFVGLLDRQHVVPGDLDGVGVIEYVQHGGVLPAFGFPAVHGVNHLTLLYAYHGCRDALFPSPHVAIQMSLKENPACVK